MYPSQVVRMKVVTPGEKGRSNLSQIAPRTEHVKNGAQQKRKTPVEKMSRVKISIKQIVIQECSSKPV